MIDDARRKRTVRSFVLRAGRLTAGQQRALEALWPRYGIAAVSAALPVNPERLPGATDYAYLNLQNLTAFPYTFQQGVFEQRLLLLGDFNLGVDSPFIASLLRETRLQATATSPEPTHAAGTVDHAFFRDLECGPARAPDTGGISDHRPLVVPFRVRTGSPR